MDITKKAMLIKLSVSQWNSKRFDAVITAKVLKDHGARVKTGRFNKSLVNGDSVKNYQRVANDARTYHYSHTLPWFDEGRRILPSSEWLKYSKKMRDFKSKFKQAAQDFITAFPGLVNHAQTDLGTMFKQGDYPTDSELKAAFRFDVQVLPIPDREDFRVEISKDEVDLIKAEIERNINGAIDGAMKNNWSRLYKAVKHMASKLKDQDAIFRDSMVGNIKELCDILPALNLTEDEKLKEMIEEVRAELSKWMPDNLRSRKLDRKIVADKADSIAKKMEAYTGGDSGQADKS